MVAELLKSPKNRLYCLAAILVLWTTAVGARLIKLQVLDYGVWQQRAQHQQQRTVEVPPPRGIIYDRNGHELAMSVKVDSWFAVPSEIPDHATTASLLAPIVGVPPAELLARMTASRSFCWVARKVDNETSARIRNLNLHGIYPLKEPKRFYPKRQLAAQVLGYVGLDDDGLGGIEHYFDEDLRGISGRMMISVDAHRARFGRVERQPDPGQNVVLTVDEKIQWIAEREVELAMQETHAEAATIIVQNPHTGEILALANRPTFDPNLFNSVSPAQLKNRAVSDVYEPGSMFKTVTVSAALDEKVTTPEEKWDASQGFIVVGGARMRDAHHMGVLTTAEVLAHSSNVGAIKIGMRLGPDRLYKYIRAYGFGQATGIELPGESRGLVKPVKNWSNTSIGAMSIGQEVGITPVQAISAVSAIANDGMWNAPRIVAGVTPPNKGPQNIVFHPADSKRVISTLTAAQMKQLMEGVVLFGTGRKALLDGYTSAGKTGTAQKANPNGGGYSGKYVASFVGFAPVNTPAITVAVIIDSAQGLHQGGQICAPVWARVAQQVLEYLDVRHDVEPKASQRAVLRAQVKDSDLDEETPDHIGAALPLNEAATTAPMTANVPMRPAPPNAGSQLLNAAAVKLMPAASVPLPNAAAQTAPTAVSGGPVVLQVGGAIVPSFLGKSLRGAIETAQSEGVEIEAVGNGVARQQEPAPGSRLMPGAKVVVRFGR